MLERVMMLDTETTNTLDDPIVYDVGFQIFDVAGTVYESKSFINRDVFCDPALMESAFYADRIPFYNSQIESGNALLTSWRDIKFAVFDTCKRHGVRIVSAHNARFDNRSLNLTQRYITTSQHRYFLPYGVEWWDTLKMAREIFKDDSDYKEWCVEHGFVTSRNVPRYTAEVVYRYISGDMEFEERHTGLEDVNIERQIFLYCWRRNPEIDGRLWAEKISAQALDKLPQV